MFKKARENGVEIWYESPAVKLVKTDGKISGIYIDRKNEGETVVKTDSVILACGGFEANKKKRMEHLGNEWEDAVVRGSEYNTGDGIEMALEAGAVSVAQ